MRTTNWTQKQDLGSALAALAACFTAPRAPTTPPSPSKSQEAFRNASRADKPMRDFLPFIDVAFEQDVLVAGSWPSLQDRCTRIQIVTLAPDSYDVTGVGGEGRTAKKRTRETTKKKA